MKKSLKKQIRKINKKKERKEVQKIMEWEENLVIAMIRGRRPRVIITD